MISHPNLIEEVSALPPSGPSTPTFKDSSSVKTFDFDDSDFKTPSQIRQIQTPDTASTPDDHTFAIPQPIFDSLKFKAPISNEDGLEMYKNFNFSCKSCAYRAETEKPVDYNCQEVLRPSRYDVEIWQITSSYKEEKLKNAPYDVAAEILEN